METVEYSFVPKSSPNFQEEATRLQRKHHVFMPERETTYPEKPRIEQALPMDTLIGMSRSYFAQAFASLLSELVTSFPYLPHLVSQRGLIHCIFVEVFTGIICNGPERMRMAFDVPPHDGRWKFAVKPTVVENVVGPASSDEDGFVEAEEEEEVKEEEEEDDENEEHNHKQDSLGPSRKKQKTSKFGMDMEELHKVFEEWQRQREANTESIMEAKPAALPNPKPHPPPPKRDQSKPKFLPKSSIKPSPVARMPGQSSEEEEWGAEEGEDGSPGEEDEESEFADAGYVLDKSGQLVDSQSEDGNQAGQLVDSQSEDENQASSSDEEIAPSAGAAGRAQRASRREERKKHGGEESTEASKKETKQRAPGAKAKTKKARSSKKNSTEVAKYLNAVSAPPGTSMSALTMDSGVKYQSPSKHGWVINFENDNTSVGKVKKSSRESPTKGGGKSGDKFDKSSTKAPSVVDLCAESDDSTEAIEVQHVVTTRGGNFIPREEIPKEEEEEDGCRM